MGAASATVVCFMDCDGSLDPADLPSVSEPVVAGRADLVLGARVAGPWRVAASMPGGRTGGSPARSATATATRSPTSDRCGRVIARPCSGLGLLDRRSGWPLEMVLRAGAAGWRVEEVAVPYRARTGRSKVTGTVGGTLRAVGDMRRQLATVR